MTQQNFKYEPWSRRSVLSLLAGAGALSVSPNLLFANTLSTKKSSQRSRLVWVTLRGGADGLNMVAPVHDPHYQALRPNLALKPEQALALNADFSLHPALAFSHQLYQQRQFAVVHCCASPYRERSHFDAQKVLENGTTDPFHPSGWLNRLVQVQKRHLPLAISAQLPLITQGKAQVNSWYPSRFNVKDEQTELLTELYQSDVTLANNLAELLSLDTSMVKNSRSKHFPSLMTQAGLFLAQSDGPNIAVLELGGWDTHAGQGSIYGAHAAQMKKLDQGLRQLHKSLGQAWQQTVVVMASEFGRTVAENGTKGTDHGTGNAMFLAGGAVTGGQVFGQWSGLQPDALFEGRDLAPTTDMRQVIMRVLHDHLQVSQSQLSDIFPNSQSLPMFSSLTRST